MFYYISGKLVHKTENYAVIDAGGIGYKLYSTKPSIDSLGEIGSNAKLYTYMNIKSASDIFDLYGFASLEELNLFEMIISVSRIGAKTALSILSNISPSKLALCIVTNDPKYIAKNTTGLGLKGAQRLVLELKDKFKGVELDNAAAEEFISGDAGTQENDAVSALMVLGYSKSESENAVKGLEGSLEDIIKSALTKLMKNQ